MVSCGKRQWKVMVKPNCTRCQNRGSVMARRVWTGRATTVSRGAWRGAACASAPAPASCSARAASPGACMHQVPHRNNAVAPNQEGGPQEDSLRTFAEALFGALGLITPWDRSLIEIVALSLKGSLSAVLFATP